MTWPSHLRYVQVLFKIYDKLQHVRVSSSQFKFIQKILKERFVKFVCFNSLTCESKVTSLLVCSLLPVGKKSLGQKWDNFLRFSIVVKTGTFYHSNLTILFIQQLSNLFTGGQFTLSTQLIKPNHLVILSPTQHHSFFRNLPPVCYPLGKFSFFIYLFIYFILFFILLELCLTAGKTTNMQQLLLQNMKLSSICRCVMD